MSPSKLVPDIKPSLVKDRSTLAKAEIILDENSRVTAVGVVYGMEHSIQGENFSAHVFLDHYNQRIRILKFTGTDIEGLIMRVRWLAEQNGFDKIICMATRRDWQHFLRHGYVLEAVLKYYHAGEDAYVVSKFRSQERITSNSLMDEILLIEDIMTKPINEEHRKITEGFEVRLARRDDIPEMIAMYQSIFETYPSPLCHADYLEHVFGRETLFAVCTKDGKVVAAASGEINAEKRAVELTDCATRPDYRGHGIMSALLHQLEEEFRKREFVCAYTMARARSYGMNNAFYQLNYEFLGRLVNNCDIYGAFEDMNIWVKNLQEPNSLN